MRGDIYVRDDHVLWRHVVDGVLLDVPGTELLTLTGPGAHLWELLAVPQTAGSAAGALAGQFDRPAAEIETQLRPLLDDLVQRGAVRRVGERA